MLDEARERATERAAIEAERQADALRTELGTRAWETLETYFPEEAKERRRRERIRALVAGVALGLGIRAVVRWWFEEE